MACDLTGGRKKPCKDAVGGVVKVHFVDFGDLGTVAIALMMSRVILLWNQI